MRFLCKLYQRWIHNFHEMLFFNLHNDLLSQAIEFSRISFRDLSHLKEKVPWIDFIRSDCYFGVHNERKSSFRVGIKNLNWNKNNLKVLWLSIKSFICIFACKDWIFNVSFNVDASRNRVTDNVVTLIIKSLNYQIFIVLNEASDAMLSI